MFSSHEIFSKVDHIVYLKKMSTEKLQENSNSTLYLSDHCGSDHRGSPCTYLTTVEQSWISVKGRQTHGNGTGHHWMKNETRQKSRKKIKTFYN